MKINHKEITPIHKACYEAIELATSLNSTTTQRDLVEAINAKLGYEALNYNEHPAHGDHCTSLWSLCKDINNSGSFDKIIVLDNYTYRLGTEEEANAYAENLYSKAMKLLERYSSLKLKIKRDGQGDFTTDTFHESFIGE